VSAFQDLPAHYYVLAAALFAFIAFFSRYVHTRRKVFDPTVSTYVVLSRGLFSWVLKANSFVWKPWEEILRGPTAPALAFQSLDRTTGQYRTVELLERKTGRIDLSVHHYVQNLTAYTQDDQEMIVQVSVPFSVSKDLLEPMLKIRDFNEALYQAVTTAVRPAIGKHLNENVGANIDTIEKEVTESLTMAARQFRDAFVNKTSLDNITPLGLNFRHVTCDTRRPSMPANAMSATDCRAISPMGFSKAHLDTVRDIFLTIDGRKDREGFKAANAALLDLLRMHTQQNIAESLVKSGHLIVLTSEELGISKNMLLRERVRAFSKPDPLPEPKE